MLALWYANRWIRLGCICGLLMLGAGVLSWYQTKPDGRLQLIFPALQGDSIIIITPQGRTILVDGGRDTSGITAQLGAELPFWKRSLDLFILTSNDSERVPGALAVARRYRIKQGLLAPLNLQRAQQEALAQTLHTQQIQLHPTNATLNIDGIEISVVNEATTEAGMSIWIQHGAVGILLAPKPHANMVELIESRSAQLVWWPWQHSDDRLIAETLQAQVVVYSEHPNEHWEHRSFLARGGDQRLLLHEDIHGNIEISSDGQTLTVSTN